MDYSANEMMTVAAARALTSDDVCFVGIGAPSAACNLARLTHAPGVTLIYESGTIGTEPNVLPLSIGDGELCETALTTVSVPEMFRYWLQGGAHRLPRRGADGSLRQPQHHHRRRLSQPWCAFPVAAARQNAVHAQQIYITMKQSPRGLSPGSTFSPPSASAKAGRTRPARHHDQGADPAMTDMPSAPERDQRAAGCQPAPRCHAGGDGRLGRLGDSLRRGCWRNAAADG